jgi:hypothetical protein
MVDSTWLGGDLGEGSGWSAEVVVDPDAGGERDEFGGDAGSESVEGAASVAFESEAVFEGPEAGLDALADRCEVRPGVGPVVARRAQTSAP